LAKSEKSRVIYLHIAPTEKEMPESLHISLDGRGGARVRELDFDLSPVPVSSRTSKGLTLTKWSVKEVKAKLPSLPAGRSKK
jgi:topoisomerase-4 subunit A